MRPKTICMMALAASAMTSSLALAQSKTDVVIMRRVIAPPTAAPKAPPAWGTPSDWTNWTSTCSAGAMRSRSVKCMRGDEMVSDDQCDAATKPTPLAQTGNFEGCTSAWSDPTYGAYDSTCSDQAQRALLADSRCLRQDGAETTGCDPAAKPKIVLNAPQYQGCTYDWVLTDTSEYSSTCSDSATKTLTYSCKRGGGTATPELAPGKCTKPDPSGKTEPVAISSGCTYTAQGSAYGTCKPTVPGGTTGKQVQTVTNCIRDSDKASVELSRCTPLERSCSITYTATSYSSTYSTCQRTTSGNTAGTQTAPATACTSSSEGSVNPSYCAPKTQACTAPLFVCGNPVANKQLATTTGNNVTKEDRKSVV